MKAPLKVPHLNQPNDFTCGPTVLAMICRYYGIRVPLATLIRIAKPNQRVGTVHASPVRAARHIGLAAKELRGTSLAALQKELATGVPPVVQYEEPEGDQHYSAVVGITAQSVILHDPWHGKNFALKRAEFLRRWRDHRTGSRRWALILRKKTTR